MLKRKSTFLTYAITAFVVIYPVYLYLYLRRHIPNHVAVVTPTEQGYSGNCLTKNVERNVDNNHRDSNREYWNQLSENSMHLYKMGWKDFIQKEKLKPLPTWSDHQGIVFVAGNDDTLKRTMGTIRLLQKEYRCKLPIEIWHMEHEADATLLYQDQVNTFENVRFRDLSDIGLVRTISRMRNRSKQFQVKAAAIINSRFQHVLYLDSDNIPTRDPTFLFDTKEYKRDGAIFWPDFWKTAGENKIFKILNIQCQDTWEQESGQIVVDKKRHWLPLQLTWYMQFFHEVYFRLLNGDKDTFQYAWQALQAPFYRVETFVGMGGLMIEGQFCGHSMLQYMQPDQEKPLFVHANLMKQIPKRVFSIDHVVERPWHLIKRYRDDRSNTFLSPEFYMVNDTKANVMIGCMNFKQASGGESPSVVASFDQVLPFFQDAYFSHKGIGGYV